MENSLNYRIQAEKLWDGSCSMAVVFSCGEMDHKAAFRPEITIEYVNQ